MGRLTKPLTLASLFAVVAATPAIAVSGPSGCSPYDAASLQAYFHRPEFNVTDGLANYAEDLSAYGNPKPVRSVSAAAASKPQQAKSVTPKLDVATLRALFRSGAFQKSDGLVTYAGR